MVKEYGQNWQETETQNLTKDITEKVDIGKKDREFAENEGPNILGDEEKYIDDMLALKEEFESDEARDREAKYHKLKFMTTHLTALTTEPESNEDEDKSNNSKPPTAKSKDRSKGGATPKQDITPAEGEGEGDAESKPPLEPRIDEGSRRWRDEVINLKQAKLVRFPKVLQSLFYLLQYVREDICEVKTNKLWWKHAKTLVNDEFFMNIFKYEPIGPKEGDYKPYQKVNYIRNLVEEIDNESVEVYSHTFSKMLQWVKTAMEVRKEDVVKRILNNRRLKAEREAAIQQEEERQNERQAFFEEEKAKWDEEMEKRREAEEERKAREKEVEAEDDEENDYAYDSDSDAADQGEGEGTKNEAEGETNTTKNKPEKEGEGDAEGEEEEEEKFDEAEVYERFDEEKPPIEIPPEVIDDIDNDIDIAEEDLTPHDDQE